MWMWTRKEFKDRAKKNLPKCYWNIVAVVFLVSIINCVISFIGGGSYFETLKEIKMMPDIDIGSIWNDLMSGWSKIFIISWLLYFFITFPVTVGIIRLILNAKKGESNIKDALFVFNKKSYLKVVFAGFMQQLYIGLWTLAFVIPGFIKYYEYRMIPYILAEKPDIGFFKALELSKKMTKYHKMDIYVLEISFIPWYLLAIVVVTFIVCILGSLLRLAGFEYIIGFLSGVMGGLAAVFIRPYMESTLVEFYLELKKNISDEDKVSLSENSNNT